MDLILNATAGIKRQAWR